MDKIKEIAYELKNTKTEFQDCNSLECFIKNKLKDYKVVVGEVIEINRICNIPYYITDLDLILVVEEGWKNLSEEDPDDYTCFINNIKLYKNINY